MSKLTKLLKLIGLLVFLYVAFFSIQNFYQGYHSIDMAYNYVHAMGDYDGQMLKSMDEVYLRGVGLITRSFVWMCLDCLGAIVIGYFWRKNDNS